MAIVRSTVILEPVSGVDRDEARNVWHFTTAGIASPPEVANIGAGLGAFYNAVADMIGSSISRAANACRVEHAVVTQGGAGPDDDVVSKLIGTTTFTLAAEGTSQAQLPSECALCFSFRGDIEGIPEEQGFDRPASRRRGRVFIGPLNNRAVGVEPVTNRVKVQNGTWTKFQTAYTALLASIDDVSGVSRHVVYSRANATAYPVTQISLDDAVDTVRRRGQRAIARDRQTVAQVAFP